MDKLKLHLLSLLVSIGLLYITFFIFETKINTMIENHITPEVESYHLKGELESAKIVLFGSSELNNHSHRFIPRNFFNNELKIPLIQHGYAYHQSFVIATELIASLDKKTKNNAKIAIFLSPGWFDTDGTNIEVFLREIKPNLLKSIFYNKHIPTKYKIWISEYFTLKKLSQINNPHLIHYYVYFYKFFHRADKKIQYSVHKKLNNINNNIDWDKLKKIAFQLEKKKSTNNKYGINNEYFSKYVKPEIKRGKFPFKTHSIKGYKHNQEFKELLKLIEICKNFKIKPIFIMQDLNPYVYKDLDNYNPILKEVKKVMKENGFQYLDMWSWNGKKDYIFGKLTDVMHTGEVGWVDVDKFIYNNLVGVIK